MNILIVDDEQLARVRLSSLIEKIPGCRTVCYAQDGAEAVDRAQDHSIDLVLMDIRLPKISGLQAARLINTLPNPPAIIFTTAFSEYALQAFSTQAAGYLLKPVRTSQLEEVLANIQHPKMRMVAEPIITDEGENNYICCRERGSIRLIALNRIYYLEAHNKYTRLCHREGVAFNESPLKHFEELYNMRLLRIHRSTLINKSYLRKMERTSTPGVFQVKLRGVNEGLIISRRNLPYVRSYLKTFLNTEKNRFA